MTLSKEQRMEIDTCQGLEPALKLLPKFSGAGRKGTGGLRRRGESLSGPGPPGTPSLPQRCLPSPKAVPALPVCLLCSCHPLLGTGSPFLSRFYPRRPSPPRVAPSLNRAFSSCFGLQSMRPQAGGPLGPGYWGLLQEHF